MGTQEISEISAGALALEDTARPEGPPLGTFDNEETIQADFMQEIEDGSLADMPKGPWEFTDIGVEAWTLSDCHAGVRSASCKPRPGLTQQVDVVVDVFHVTRSK